MLNKSHIREYSHRQVIALLSPPRVASYSASTTIALHSQLTDFISIGRKVFNGLGQSRLSPLSISLTV